MMLLTHYAHLCAALLCHRGHRAFENGMAAVERHQRRILKRILDAVAGTPSAARYGLTGKESAERIRQKIPLTRYTDWEDLIVRQMTTGRPCLSTSACSRYQPTSGSTSAVKWIPYTRQFLDQLEPFISPWMYRLYQKHKRIRFGRHYWSLSWVPTELRSKVCANVNDDLKLVPFSKRIFLQLTMAVPNAVAQAPTSEDAMFATACYLSRERRLSLISVWSPTFILGLIDFMSTNRLEISAVLDRGTWGRRSAALGNLGCPQSPRTAGLLREWNGKAEPSFLARLWPCLALISAWDSATSALWAGQVRVLFPGVAFDGKGLLATEGVVTLPFKDTFALAYLSHFFEFWEPASGKSYFAWELEPGQVLQPVLTTGSGLLRYVMNDQVRVVDRIGQCPCFLFLGRSDGIDLVGEKMSHEATRRVLARVAAVFPVKPLSLLAIPQTLAKGAARYLLLCEGRPGLGPRVAAMVEEMLNESFHYKLARQVGQLNAAACLISPQASRYYAFRAAKQGMVAGNLKIEALVLWNCELPEVFREALETPSIH